MLPNLKDEEQSFLLHQRKEPFKMLFFHFLRWIIAFSTPRLKAIFSSWHSRNIRFDPRGNELLTATPSSASLSLSSTPFASAVSSSRSILVRQYGASFSAIFSSFSVQSHWFSQSFVKVCLRWTWNRSHLLMFNDKYENVLTISFTTSFFDQFWIPPYVALRLSLMGESKTSDFIQHFQTVILPSWAQIFSTILASPSGPWSLPPDIPPIPYCNAPPSSLRCGCVSKSSTIDRNNNDVYISSQFAMFFDPSARGKP